ncbi:MAG TPA: histidine phosphatase family protein [Candidatus Dormibacteraeota bacterium]|nr:histidine phosphatase family protein [Candidatus Dormibacteraeota bacterium]
MRLLLIRHAQTVWNAAGRVQGQSDPPLSQPGLEQCSALGVRVAGLRLDALYSSDLQRARLTAEAVSGATGVPVTLDTGLREVGLGRWEGATAESLRREDPELFAQWQRAPSWDLVPGGEGTAAFESRVLGAVVRIVASRGDTETVAAVTHIGVIRLVLSMAAGLQSLGQLWPWAIDNTGLTTLVGPADVSAWDTPALRILAVNDSLHMARSAEPG